MNCFFKSVEIKNVNEFVQVKKKLFKLLIF